MASSNDHDQSVDCLLTLLVSTVRNISDLKSLVLVMYPELWNDFYRFIFGNIFYCCLHDSIKKLTTTVQPN